MLQNKIPNKNWLILDDIHSIRKPSIKVSFPLLSKNKIVMKKLIDFVKYSQNPKKNYNNEIRIAVGLAAPQIGYNIKMYYIYIEYKNNKNEIEKIIEHAIINPKIIWKSTKIICIKEGEGCLSVNIDKIGFVPRSFCIIIDGYDYLKKQKVRITTSSYEAIVFQHEQEHLEGKLYYDLINKKNPWFKKKSWIIL